MYKYKSRIDAIKQAFTLGLEQAEELRLDQDYRNWSPLMLYCYYTGAGCSCAFFVFFVILLVALIII